MAVPSGKEKGGTVRSSRLYIHRSSAAWSTRVSRSVWFYSSKKLWRRWNGGQWSVDTEWKVEEERQPRWHAHDSHEKMACCLLRLIRMCCISAGVNKGGNDFAWFTEIPRSLEALIALHCSCASIPAIDTHSNKIRKLLDQCIGLS